MNRVLDRVQAAAVVSALKAAGVRVKNWRNFVNGDAEATGCPTPETGGNRVFAFGRDLLSLPQCEVLDVGGTVPQFLVDACQFLSLHLGTEGLFRKTGSLTRIRVLRARLEQGEPLFLPPLSAALQPCDVATLLKQFLRELPSPLIPPALQGALCRAQGLGGEDRREGATLLLTALLPPAHARVLRYLCSFLRSAAQRSSESRMDLGSLALVISPNLMQCPISGSRLAVGTEAVLERQAAVVRALITHAEHIGVIPTFMLEKKQGLLLGAEPGCVTPPGDALETGAGPRVPGSVKHHRRSVGERFVGAFNKLMTSRTPTGTPVPFDGRAAEGTPGQQGEASPMLQSLLVTKRKAFEDTVPEPEGSARKRRSIQDLREESPVVSLSPPSDPVCSQSSQPCRTPASVLPQLRQRGEGSTPNRSVRSKRGKRTADKRAQRPPAAQCAMREERGDRFRRSLRLFSLSGWGGRDSVSIGSELGRKKVTDSQDGHSCSKGGGLSEAPVTPVGGPERVVVCEVDDDPDLLTCSFVDSPGDSLYPETFIHVFPDTPTLTAQAEMGSPQVWPCEKETEAEALEEEGAEEDLETESGEEEWESRTGPEPDREGEGGEEGQERGTEAESEEGVQGDVLCEKEEGGGTQGRNGEEELEGEAGLEKVAVLEQGRGKEAEAELEQGAGLAQGRWGDAEVGIEQGQWGDVEVRFAQGRWGDAEAGLEQGRWGDAEAGFEQGRWGDAEAGFEQGAWLQEGRGRKEDETAQAEEWPFFDVFRSDSRELRPPRRSYSLPEGISIEMDESEGEEERSEESRSTALQGDPEPEEDQELGEGESWSYRALRPRQKEEKPRGEGGKDGAREGQIGSVSKGRSPQVSVADRVRSFNSLSSRLWAPLLAVHRPSPLSTSPLFFQRNSVLRVAQRFGGAGGGGGRGGGGWATGPLGRLRRQGARRFGRSLSHESSLGLLEGHEGPEPQ
ncbi:rho GTPase-activating protein 30 isoform X2 [Lepisosteus oculatus]|uniref:rho GTPase-activating protein 30 isoform X2 n=1 Tax=Lepisosteus oculatus TaxID=7918 RepID=UPI003712C88B